MKNTRLLNFFKSLRFWVALSLILVGFIIGFVVGTLILKPSEEKTSVEEKASFVQAGKSYTFFGGSFRAGGIVSEVRPDGWLVVTNVDLGIPVIGSVYINPDSCVGIYESEK